jgi:MHS family alpha-ketoglutarate permease-like MFS transporter
LLLLLARLLQGFATGGEYGASATYMSEAAIPGRRGFLSSFHYVTLVGGHVLAQATLLLMLHWLTPATDLQTGAGAWRSGWAASRRSWCSGCGGRWTNRSTPASIEAARTGKAGKTGSLRELFVHQWRPLLLCFLITAGGTLAFYTYSVIGPKMVQAQFAGGDVITGTAHQPRRAGRADAAAAAGRLAVGHRRDARRCWWASASAGCSTPGSLCLHLPQQAGWLQAFGVLTLGFVILTGYTSINAVVKAELFPTHVRALGVGLGYALANSAFGGTAPLLYQASLRSDHVETFVLYATAVIAVSLLVYVFFLENKGRNWLDDADVMDVR